MDRGGSSRVHAWPTGGSPNDPNVVLLQDFLYLIDFWQIALSASKLKAYPVHGQILKFWSQNSGYSNYGAPMSTEYPFDVKGPGSGNYGGGQYGQPGHNLTVQKFSKVSGPLKTLAYNNQTGALGSFPLGRFEINKDAGQQWWIKGTGGNPDRKWPKVGILSPTGNWWIDASTHNFVRKDAQGNDIMGTGFTVVIWEGNSQFTDGSGTPLTNPVAVTNLATSNVTSNAVTLTWTDPNSPVAAPYQLNRDDGVKFGGITARSYTDNTVQPGYTYIYTVSVNNGPESMGVTVTTPASSGGGGQQGTIYVSSPNGGTYPVSSILTISWSGTTVNGVSIDLSRDGGQTWEHLNDRSGSQTYLWQVTGPESEQCLIRITEHFNAQNTGVSNGFFTIGNPNHPPTAQSFSTSVVYRNALVIDLTSKVTDTDGAVNWSTLTVTSSPNGTSVVNTGAHTITFTPNFLYVGVTQVKYKVQDNDQAWSNEGVITIDVQVTTSAIANGGFETGQLSPWVVEATRPSDVSVQQSYVRFSMQSGQWSYVLSAKVPGEDLWGRGQDTVTVLQKGISLTAGSHTLSFDGKSSRSAPITFELLTHDRRKVLWRATTSVLSGLFWTHSSVRFTLASPAVNAVFRIKLEPTWMRSTCSLDNVALDGVLGKVAGSVDSEADRQSLIPEQFALYQNYPNPFNPETTIRYQLAGKSEVSLKVYNLLGQEVATLVNTTQELGVYRVQWNGTNLLGQKVATGVYLFQLKAGDFIMTRKMVIMK